MAPDIYNNFSGPNLIVAGPGTGKTTTLVRKIKNLVNYLIENGKTQGNGIIVCTFTRKAAEELKIRLFSELSISNFSKVDIIIGTIHSICYELLSRYSQTNYSEYQILPEDEQIHFVYSKLPNFLFNESQIRKNGWQIADDMSVVFNKLTDGLVDVKTIDFKGDEELESYCKNYDRYKKILENKKLFDFATIQEKLLKELDNKAFLQKLQDIFSYFFIDEYQDVNDIQDKIFKILSSKNNNITVVGDDDQCIYGFRGTSVKYLLDFDNYYTRLKVPVSKYSLDVNYRSTKEIIYFNNVIAAKSRIRTTPKILSANRKEKYHTPVVLNFDTDVEEAQFVCEQIKNLKAKGFISNYNEVGILFRSVRSHANAMLKELVAAEIPSRLFGAGNLFDTVLGQEFLALLDFALAKDPAVRKGNLLKNIKDIDSRFLSNLQSVYTGTFIDSLDKSLFKKFKTCIDLTYALLINSNFFNRYYLYGENIGILTGLAIAFDELSTTYQPFEFFGYLCHLRKEKTVDFENSSLDEAVNVMTIHQAKGLEFPVVFVVSQNYRKKKKSISERLDEIMGRTDDNNILDEERRVFYVACTRAQDLLFVSSSTYIEDNKKEYYPIDEIIDIVDCDPAVSVDSFDLKKIPEVKRVSKKKKVNDDILSYNKVRLYNECPLAYKYSNVWHLQTAKIAGLEYGSNVHNILEKILKSIKTGIKAKDIDLNRLLEENWVAAKYRSKEEDAKFKAIALEQINKFVEQHASKYKPENIIAVEDEFNVIIGDTMITGRFDAVLKFDGKYLVLDFKTGDEKDYSGQLSFYSVCFKEKYMEEPDLALYFLKTGILKKVEATEYKKEIELIKKTTENINNGLFDGKCSDYCNDCAYTNICDLYKGSSK